MNSPKSFELEFKFRDLIYIPSIHVITYRNNFGTMVAHCLDYGIYAHSEIEDEAQAQEDVLSQIWRLSVFNLFNANQTGSLENLFANASALDNQSDWSIYHRARAQEKIQSFLESLVKIKEYDKKFIEQYIAEKIRHEKEIYKAVKKLSHKEKRKDQIKPKEIVPGLTGDNNALWNFASQQFVVEKYA